MPKKSTVTSAIDLVPKKRKIMKQKLMTKEILELRRNKQRMKDRKSLEYRMIGKEIKRQCKIAKETWYSKKCEEIERNPHEIYKKIDDIRGKRRYCSASACTKGNDNSIIFDRDKILERRSEYIEELFDDNRGGVPEIHKNIEGLSILSFEVRAALKKMRNSRAPGPDGIMTEMIKAVDDFGIEKITKLADEIYENGKIPADLFVY